jgi:RNA polymerase sigma factor (sigma-70 family)
MGIRQGGGYPDALVAPPFPASDFPSAYADHVGQVYGFFAYRGRSREEAEDLTQLTFERALRAWGRYDARKAQVGTWLLAIARNLLIDRYRSEAVAPRTEPLDDASEHHLPNAELGASLGVSPELAAGLARLEVRAQEIVALRFGGDLTGPEIAQVTGLTLANVQQILSRSLRQLRSDLGERNEQQSAAARGQARDPGA